MCFLAKQMVEKKSFLSCPYQNISQQQQQNILLISLSIPYQQQIQDQQKNKPSGKRLQLAIENCHRNSGFSHEKWWIFP